MELYTYRYITLFDNLGFEGIIDITCDKQMKAEAALHDEPDPEIEMNKTVKYMVFRARANPQRTPEVWMFWSDVDEKILWEYSQESPQALADLIRKDGFCVFKTPKPASVIT
jgi:hypothetical protein